MSDDTQGTNCLAAMRAWLGNGPSGISAVEAVYQHWRDRWRLVVNTSPAGRLTLIHELAACGLTPEPQVFDELQRFVDVDHAAAAERLLAGTGLSPQHTALAIDQTAELVPAIAKSALAAVLFRQELVSQAAQRLGEAAAHYQRAWSFEGDAAPRPASNPFGNVSASVTCWNTLTSDSQFDDGWKTLNPSTAWPSLTTVLILQRLLAVLFGEADLVPSYQNDLQMMLVRSDGRGDIGDVRVVAVESERPGFFLDPLTFGVTALDDTMRESLRLAWNCCAAPLRETPRIVWIQPDFDWHVPLLHGDSAGGLVACGLYATALGKPLDRRRTASCALTWAGPQSTAFDPSHVALTGVGGVPGKWNKLREQHDLVELVLEQGQAEIWNRRHPDHLPPPQISGAGSLAELFEKLTGDARHESLLQQHAECVAGAWERRSSAGSDASAARSDRDENETHRFDCYLQPHYRIELSQSVANARETAAEDAAQDAPVPGEHDERLRNVLELMLHRSVWDDAPNELHEAQQRFGPRWLVAYDNAGAGKTVFSYRMAHVLAARESWSTLFDDRAPLIIRQEGRWLRDRETRRPLSLVDFLTEIVLRDSREAGRNLDDSRDTVRAAVRYALDARRVVIILDGFDQFADADRSHVVDLLSSRGQVRSDRDYADAVNQCRWIVTGRVHVIDGHRRRNELFLDSHWLRLRIEPFSPEQQDAYFAQSSSFQPAIGDRWLRLIGIGESTDDATRNAIRERLNHLLQLPMTLWYLRRLIEQTRENETLPVFGTLSELAVITGRRTLERALETSAEVTTVALAEQGITSPFANDPRKQLRLLEHVLTLLAFQLMLEQKYDGRVDPDEMDRFESRCERRWFHPLDMQLQQSGLPPSRRRQLEQQLDSHNNQWRWALAVLKSIELNHRSVTEVYASDRLAFRSRKVVEACAARYLTRYADDWDIRGDSTPEYTGDDPERACAWDFTNDPEWKPCWMLAIEMPRHPGWHRLAGHFEDAHLDPAVTLNAFSILFEQPKREIRPNQLIYHAWPLFEFDEQLIRGRLFLPDGEQAFRYGDELPERERRRLGESLLLPGAADVIERFRSTSRDLVAELERNTQEQQRLAAKLGHEEWLRRWQEASYETKSKTLVDCPPQAWIDAYERGERTADPCVNVIGSPDTDTDAQVDEWPQHRVRVEPFASLATPVTNGLYALFDPAFAGSELKRESQVILIEDPEDDIEEDSTSTVGIEEGDRDFSLFPETDVDYFEAWVFCRWLGPNHRLPSECEQEFSIRGGTATRYCWGDIEELLAEYAQGYGEVGRLRPNDYGVFDGHGLVSEWSLTWWDEKAYAWRVARDDVAGTRAEFDALPDEQREALVRRALGDAERVFEADFGAVFGHSVVLRGTRFFDRSPRTARSASRSRDNPGYRGLLYGFRVVRVRREKSQSSSFSGTLPSEL